MTDVADQDAQLIERRLDLDGLETAADREAAAAAMADRVAKNNRLGRRTCRICGCWELSACEGGCWWAGDDLCSTCEPTE